MIKNVLSALILSVALISSAFATSKSFDISYTIANHTRAPISYFAIVGTDKVNTSKLVYSTPSPIKPGETLTISGSYSVEGLLNPAGDSKSIRIALFQDQGGIFESHITPTPYRGTVYSNTNIYCDSYNYQFANNMRNNIEITEATYNPVADHHTCFESKRMH